MSLPLYSQGNTVLILFGRRISEFGDSEPPIKIEYIDEKGALKRGFAGSAVRGQRINPGVRLTVALMPDSNDSSFLSGKLASDSEASGSFVTIGTGEGIILEEGVATTIGEIGRGGMLPSDDVYIYEFNKDVIKLGAI